MVVKILVAVVWILSLAVGAALWVWMFYSLGRAIF